MNWAVALRLGRVSNLPTVWTNVLTGTVLAGSIPMPFALGLLLLAISLFYVAGMYLNDAFDRHFDTTAYPQRPIPSGAVAAGTVFTIGFLGLGAGELLLIVVGYGVEGGRGLPPVIAGLCLAATIVFYSAHHKGNPLGPLLMSLCRAQVYLTTALAVSSELAQQVWWGIGLLVAYVIGLSYVARQETLTRLTNLWPLAMLAAPLIYGLPGALRNMGPAVIYMSFVAWVVYAVWRLMKRTQTDIREGVSGLIAGIALLDALLISLAG
ncbi:MAG TPA: UbiA family prenyltransferase, partial [Nitrospiraceae bacterium]|nr:UbiA family prenyltransferase [Nitrospiraceae bacterium]